MADELIVNSQTPAGKFRKTDRTAAFAVGGKPAAPEFPALFENTMFLGDGSVRRSSAAKAQLSDSMALILQLKRTDFHVKNMLVLLPRWLQVCDELLR